MAIDIKFKDINGVDWKIGSDSRQYILYKKHIRKNKDTGEMEDVWDGDIFYQKIEDMLAYLIEMQCRTSDCTSLAELKDTVMRANRAVRELLVV